MQSLSVLALTIIATATVTAERFITATGATATAGGNALGVTRSDGKAGDALPVDVLGTAVVTAGGVIAQGALVEVGATGNAVAHDEGVAVARALTAAAADGDRIEVFLIPN